MIRLQSIFRLILAAVSLLLSVQAPAFAGRTVVIHDGSRKLIDGRDRPGEHAVLTAEAITGHSATRHFPVGGGGGAAVPALPGVSHPVGDRCAASQAAALREYWLRNAHIVPALFQALFPKHWFW